MVELVDQVRRSCIWTCFGKKKGLVGKEFRALEVKGNVLDGAAERNGIAVGFFRNRMTMNYSLFEDI